MKIFLRLMALSLIFPGAAFSGGFSDFRDAAIGLFTDPLGLSRGAKAASQSAERILVIISKMQDELDEDTRDYIEQVGLEIDKIRVGAASDMQNLINLAAEQVEGLEKRIFENAAKTARCTGAVAAEQVKSTAGEILNDLARRDASLIIFGRRAARFDIERHQMPSPIESFNEAKSVLEQRLKNINEYDVATEITDIHGEMQRLAEMTRCHFSPLSATYDRLFEIEIEYLRLDQPWRI